MADDSMLMIVMVIFMIAIAGGGGAFYYYKTKEKKEDPVTSSTTPPAGGDGNATTPPAATPIEWLKKEKQDLWGFDIERKEGKSVDDLKTACLADTKCVAFNSDGWLKHRIPHESELTGSTADIYIKGGKLNATPLYTLYAKKDDAGSEKDIVRVEEKDRDIRILRSWCASDANCKAFNSGGWLKKVKVADAAKLADSEMDYYAKNE